MAIRFCSGQTVGILLGISLCAAARATAQSQPPVFTTIYNFTSGTASAGPTYLVIGGGGVLYGLGGDTVFSLTPPAAAGGTWTETVLHTLTGDDGGEPRGLVLSGDGVLYGITADGGLGCDTGATTSITTPGAAVRPSP